SPATGKNEITPSSRGLPSTVTLPLTWDIVLSPQPASTSSVVRKTTAPAIRLVGVMVSSSGIEVGPGQVVAVHGAEGLPGRQRDAVRHKMDRAIGHGDVHTARVPAAGSVELFAGHAYRHQRVVIGDRPVHHVAHGAVRRGKRHEMVRAVVVLNIPAPVV